MADGMIGQAGVRAVPRYSRSFSACAGSSARTYKVRYLCLPCRVTTKRRPEERAQFCNRCREPMVDAGRGFAAPRSGPSRHHGLRGALRP